MFLFDNKSNIAFKSQGIEFQSLYIDDFSIYFDFRNDTELDVLRLDSGKFAGYISRFVMEEIILELSQRNCLMKFNALIPNHWLIAIPIKNKPILYNYSYHVQENYIAVIPPGQEFSGVQSAFSHRFHLYITENYLDRVASFLQLPKLTEITRDRFEAMSVFNCSPNQIRQLQQSCLQLYKLTHEYHFHRKHQSSISLGLAYIQRKITQDLLENILTAVFQSHHIQPRRTFIKRMALLKKTETLMQNRLKSNFSINECCEKLDISQRTLQYLFRDFYQLSPQRYFKILRLNAFHDSLQQAKQNINIFELAEQFGFFHRGQLARDYARLFNELPSATLSTNPKSYP